MTELRRRDLQLVPKAATIREIHHRVKNNLQTVSALLRLQSRRMTSEEAKHGLLAAASEHPLCILHVGSEWPQRLGCKALGPCEDE